MTNTIQTEYGHVTLKGKRKLPPNNLRCTAPTRTCRNCLERFTKEDKKEKTCPTCKEEIRCIQYSVHVSGNYPVCTKHGAGAPLKGRPGGRPRKDGIMRNLLPQNLVPSYDEAMGDERLEELRKDIALEIALRDNLISQLEDGGAGGKVFKQLKIERKKQNSARRAGNYEEVKILDDELDSLILEGVRQYSLEKEIDDKTNLIRKLKVDEERRKNKLNQYVPIEQVLMLMSKIATIFETVVRDRELVKAFVFQLEDLVAIDGNYKELK